MNLSGSTIRSGGRLDLESANEARLHVTAGAGAGLGVPRMPLTRGRASLGPPKLPSAHPSCNRRRAWLEIHGTLASAAAPTSFFGFCVKIARALFPKKRRARARESRRSARQIFQRSAALLRRPPGSGDRDFKRLGGLGFWQRHTQHAVAQLSPDLFRIDGVIMREHEFVNGVTTF